MLSQLQEMDLFSSYRVLRVSVLVLWLHHTFSPTIALVRKRIDRHRTSLGLQYESGVPKGGRFFLFNF